jgi:hypothetical protein
MFSCYQVVSTLDSSSLQDHLRQAKRFACVILIALHIGGFTNEERIMSKKTRISGFSAACVCGLAMVGVSKVSAQLLPGNVWPNPGFNIAAPAGVDQVYSYYNGTYSSGGPYMPNTTGDTNPRPDGWHRGGSDFGTTSAPAFCFYTPGEGSLPSPAPSGNAVQVNDTSLNGYGEWFSDFNALPASSVNGGTPIDVRFFWEYSGLASTQRPTDQFRVSVDFADSVGDDTLTAPNTIGSSVDDLLIIPGTADQTAFTEVDEIITPPVGAYSMRITVDSGGSSQAIGQIAVDDISVAAVPEPTGIAALGAAAMLLAARRRRQV